MRLPALLPFLLSAALATPALLPTPAPTPPSGAPIPITGTPAPIRPAAQPIRVGGTPTPGAALIGPSQPTSGGGTLTLALNPAQTRAERPAPTQTSAPSQTSAPTLPAARVTIQPGDTLSSLARRHQTSVTELQRLNALTSSAISVGQTLRVPTRPCGVLTCAATTSGYLAPDGTLVRYTATTLTLTGPVRTLWPELTRPFITGDPLPIYTALLRPCAAGSSPHPLIRCTSEDTVTLTLP